MSDTLARLRVSVNNFFHNFIFLHSENFRDRVAENGSELYRKFDWEEIIMDDTITISKKEYDHLVEAKAILDALLAAGVDN